MAAGILLVQEADSQVSRMQNEAIDLYRPYLLDDNGLIHAETLALFEKTRRFWRRISASLANMFRPQANPLIPLAE